MKNHVIIVAGGKGLRMGSDLPKQFIPVADKPLLMHTICVFYEWDKAIKIILVLPESHQSYWNMLCKELGFTIPHCVVNGGETRFHSVLNGLNEVSEEGFVAVHDGVRPFVSPEVITACFEEAVRTGAAVPVIPMIDSLRHIEGGVSHPVDRTKYFAVQTPQVFSTTLLHKAYSLPYTDLFTDDASVVEAYGESIGTVEGNRENIKITTSLDLIMAKAMLEK